MVIISMFIFLAIAVVVIAAIIMVGFIGVGSVAAAAGGLAGVFTINDKYTKTLALLLCLSIFFFAVCCLALVGGFIWGRALVGFAIIGCVSAMAALILGILSLKMSLKIEKTSTKALLIVLSVLATLLGVAALIVHSLIAVLVIMVPIMT
ncbi:MAG: hypothetical protein FWG00_05740 [Coriobacteriia bacterium]|nr:hypothetical protein [Coriobacteriia bacterium]